MQPITDAIWANLKEHFNDKQILEVSFTIGLNQLVSRFHATVLTDVDDSTLGQLAGSCRVPHTSSPQRAG